MPIADQAKTSAELAQHLPHLSALVQGAWQDVEDLPPALRLIMCTRTRASLVHDFMLKRAAEYAEQAEDVRYFQRQSMHGLVVNGRYAIRFKKLDEESRSKNQPTQQVTEFRAQIELDGIDAAHNLEIGYVLNDFGTDIADVRLTCPSGSGNAWVMSVRDAVGSTIVSDIFAPANETIEAADIKPRQRSADVLKFPAKGGHEG